MNMCRAFLILLFVFTSVFEVAARERATKAEILQRFRRGVKKDGYRYFPAGTLGFQLFDMNSNRYDMRLHGWAFCPKKFRDRLMDDLKKCNDDPEGEKDYSNAIFDKKCKKVLCQRKMDLKFSDKFTIEEFFKCSEKFKNAESRSRSAYDLFNKKLPTVIYLNTECNIKILTRGFRYLADIKPDTHIEKIVFENFIPEHANSLVEIFKKFKNIHKISLPLDYEKINKIKFNKFYNKYNAKTNRRVFTESPLKFVFRVNKYQTIQDIEEFTYYLKGRTLVLDTDYVINVSGFTVPDISRLLKKYTFGAPLLFDTLLEAKRRKNPEKTGKVVLHGNKKNFFKNLVNDILKDDPYKRRIGFAENIAKFLHTDNQKEYKRLSKVIKKKRRSYSDVFHNEPIVQNFFQDILFRKRDIDEYLTKALDKKYSNSKDEYFKALLYTCLKYNCSDLLYNKIIAKVRDSDFYLVNGRGPLYEATLFRRYKRVKNLLSLGANPYPEHTNKKPIDKAIYFGDIRLFNLFYSKINFFEVMNINYPYYKFSPQFEVQDGTLRQNYVYNQFSKLSSRKTPLVDRALLIEEKARLFKRNSSLAAYIKEKLKKDSLHEIGVLNFGTVEGQFEHNSAVGSKFIVMEEPSFGSKVLMEKIGLRPSDIYDAIKSRKYAYERFGAIVYGSIGDWYKVKFKTKTGWIHKAYGQFFSIEEYLTSGDLDANLKTQFFKNINGKTVDFSKDGYVPKHRGLSVYKTKWVNGVLWANVKYGVGHCGEESTPYTENLWFKPFSNSGKENFLNRPGGC